MTRSTFVGSILGYVGGLGPHFCRGVPWSPDIVPYKTGEQPTTLNAQGDLFAVYKIMPSVSLAVFTTYLIYLSLSWVSIRFLFFWCFPCIFA